MTVVTPPDAVPPATQLRSLVRSHPAAAFFTLAYLYSWAFWAPAALGYDGAPAEVAIFVGVWGPAAAGATVTRLSGRSVRAWIRGMLRWRAARRWYVFALAIPAAIVGVVSVAFVALGEDLDTSLLGERLAIYIPVLIFLTLLGGGNEEWGWRGFALPTLLQRHTPMRATLILGGLWAIWHLPLLAAMDDLSHGLGGGELTVVLAATVVNIVGLAFFYTFLYRHTGSVLLAVLLHGSFNAANGTLVLREEIEGSAYATMQYCITATTLIVAALLVWVSRGRLGPPDDPAATDHVVDLRTAPPNAAREPDRSPVSHG